MKKYIFNLETTKIELHFEKADYAALSDEQKREIKNAFLWSNKGKCWVSRAKEPNLYRAKQVASKLGFTEEQREGERISYAEQLERQTERAEARADRYEGYAANAEGRAAQLQKPIHDMHGDNSFFTQPNINSSAGRAFTNRREKMYAQYERGFEEYRKSAHFQEKAAVARGTASQVQYENPGYLDRRIKECKKEIRDREKNIIYYEGILCAVENGEEKKWRGGEVVTAESVQALIEQQLELIEKAMDKQGYLENCFEALGGYRFCKDNIKVGYIVLIKRWGQVEIISTGPTNVGFKILSTGGTLQAAYAEIDEIIKAEKKEKETHTFVVGEQFTAKTWDGSLGFGKGRFNSVVYEIVKASSKTISLKVVGSDDKPITRKPVKTYGGNWRFSIDDTHGNTFTKRPAKEEI